VKGRELEFPNYMPKAVQKWHSSRCSIDIAQDERDCIDRLVFRDEMREAYDQLSDAFREEARRREPRPSAEDIEDYIGQHIESFITT
jgi:hypothetical protein